MNADLEAVLADVRVVFRQESPARAGAIRALMVHEVGGAIGDDARRSVAGIAHILKGTGGTLGFTEVSRLAGALEAEANREPAAQDHIVARALSLAAALDALGDVREKQGS
jgi:chemotaxis protein histidine kinase CheA